MDARVIGTFLSSVDRFRAAAERDVKVRSDEQRNMGHRQEGRHDLDRYVRKVVTVQPRVS